MDLEVESFLEMIELSFEKEFLDLNLLLITIHEDEFEAIVVVK